MRNFRWKKHLSFILVLSAGLALRLWFLKHAPSVEGDTTIYGNIATNLLRSHVYGYSETDAGVEPTLIRLPGYPLFLMLCFRLFGVGNYIAVMLVQTAFDLGTCVLLSRLAFALFGRRSAFAALVASALCPFTANYIGAPLTETLTLFLITIALYSLYQWLVSAHRFGPWLWSLSAALAYAALLRPEQILLAVSILGTLLWNSLSRPKHRPRVCQLMPVLAAALCTLLPLAPWTLRNWRTFHVFQPLAPRSATDPGEHVPTGFQHWYRSWAVDFASTEDVYWKYEDTTIDIADLPRRAFDSPAQYRSTAALLQDYNLTTTDSPDLNRRFEDLARERNHTHPLRSILLLPLARLANMLLRPRTEMTGLPSDWWKVRDHLRQSATAAGYAALNLLWLVPGTIGLYRWSRVLRSETPAVTAVFASMLAFVLLRSLLLLTLDNSEPRYTLEFFPILTLGIAFLFRRTRAIAPTAFQE